MEIPIYQVDAFAARLFAGNPAAVCPLRAWLPDRVMQAIAAENNLSETAFFVAEDDGYALRWFTPTVEVPLCGHATLASGFVVADILALGTERVVFRTRSGLLEVTRRGELFALDLPASPPQAAVAPARLIDGLGLEPAEVLASSFYLVLLRDEAAVASITPDMGMLAALDRAVIVTARGREVDFVSRCFAPTAGIPEDPVTGSAHCVLTPYWAKRLGRSVLQARQMSARGGELVCEDRGDRVSVAGRAILYLEGRLHV